ncbi:MAG TPA: alpha/beta hydrolase [Terriglobales bacterium]|nr:alpha/beta hydrolase [Terriglobales bacterium]
MAQLHQDRLIFGEECWSVVAGHRMRYLRAGSGPPLVLIHGLFGYSFSWRFNWEPLAKDFTVYAVDLLGIGFSDRPNVGAVPYDLPTTADRMLDWMAQAGIRDAILLGTSHGGGLVLAMAARDRQKGSGLIRKLVSVAGVNPWTTRGHKRAAVFGHPIGGAIFKLLAPIVGIPRLSMLERMYGDNSLLTEATREGYQKGLDLPRTIDYGIGICRTWRSDLSYLRTAVEQIGDLPTLLIWGRRDKVVPLAGGEELNRHLKNAKLVVMDRAGHLPYEEYPEEFNRILLQYLRES